MTLSDDCSWAKVDILGVMTAVYVEYMCSISVKVVISSAGDKLPITIFQSCVLPRYTLQMLWFLLVGLVPLYKDMYSSSYCVPVWHLCLSVKYPICEEWVICLFFCILHYLFLSRSEAFFTIQYFPIMDDYIGHLRGISRYTTIPTNLAVFTAMLFLTVVNNVKNTLMIECSMKCNW